MAEFAASFKANLNNNGDSFETEFSSLRDRFSAGFGDVVPMEIPGAVHYDVEQELTEEEQARARQNIGVTEAAGPVLFTAEGSFSTREAPATFTLSLSSRALFEALRSAEGRQEGLAGVFYAEGDGSKYAVPVTVSEASVMNMVFAAVFVFGPNATPLGFTVQMSDEPMQVAVPASILNAIFNCNADVDQLVRTEPQNLRAAQQTQARTNIGAGTYSKPSGGIPETDLNSATQNKIDGAATSEDLAAHTGNADIHVTAMNKLTWSAKYSKPSTGIPASDLDAITQSRINGAASNADLTAHTGNADIHVTAAQKTEWSAKYDKPNGGIPDTDLADKYAGAAEAGGTADRAASIPYGECDSTSTATAFTATVPGITELRDGVCMLLKNGVVTSASGFTININGLGAKGAYTNLAAATRDTTLFNVNYTMLFIYSEDIVSGGAWICYRGYDANTNTIGYQIRTNSYSLPMKSITYRYRILFTAADGAHFVPATNSTSTNATASRTVCQDPIDPFGPIVYYGTTASVAAGSRPSASYLWQEYTLSLGYSFNRTGAALTLTSWKPVYVKCAPQTDGSAIIDATTPYVQDLPTTADGKIYIYLGVAYSATNIELNLDHPVYYHDGNGIKLWTGSTGGSYTETDPTVPAWAKEPTKPTYTAVEVGALPDSTVVPTSTSQLANDSGYITGSDVPTYEADPSVPQWAKQPTKPAYTASEVGAAEEPLIIQATLISGTTYYQLDKTVAQIFAALTAGRYVAVQTPDYTFPYTTFVTYFGETVLVFGATLLMGDTALTNGFVILQSQGVGMYVNLTSPMVSTINGLEGDVTLNISDLTNDAGYITLADLPIWDGGVT